MKKLSLMVLLVFASLSLAFAQTAAKVDESSARKTAQAFANTQSTLKGQGLNLVTDEGNYIYNIGNQGFVIIAGNTILPPVLAWSDQGIFPEMEEAPENFAAWIRHYSEMIDFAVANGIQPEASIQHLWDEAAQGVFGTRNLTTVEPLVSTRWNQDCYYNEYCPATGGGWWWGGPCGHCYAGCVATAMAQVMKYWDYPATGFGSHSYVHSQYGEQSANFGATNYNWSQMPVEIYSHNDAVATLLYHCGVSVNMNYSESGSGAGVYLNNYVTLNNCTIVNNEASMYGGGVYINSTGGTVHVTLHNCRIMDNNASMGGGVCDRIGAEYTNCRISNNIASTKGGGIYLYNNTTPTLKNCVISNNTANNAGGMYARGQFTAYNCDFVMNLATESVGGIYHENSHNKYYNCIVWGNVANGLPNQFAGLSDFDHCAVCGIVNGSDNYDIPNENNGDEPGIYVRFNHPASGAGANHHNEDWSLRPRSICLNAGKPNTTGLGNTDIGGNPRLQKGRVDIGAYESCASLTQIEDAFYESQSPYWFFSRPLTEPGYYTAVIPTQECDSVIGLTLMVLEGIEEDPSSTSSGAVAVWPNPMNGLLHIDADGIEKAEVYNALGQKVLRVTKSDSIDLSHLENGVYFLIVTDKNGLKSSIKVIKE